ncbi:hypothetical protein ZOSMA_113G00550 [Zostera marina]|uniref:DUF7866 domain-containing protein n=1 Tax=Zostera marina TaxID=29655 RepID=A0A0K9Q4X7_ZOSMR|nr:hypothetical protein ZOSMA_113G00550 [Zostera marina]
MSPKYLLLATLLTATLSIFFSSSASTLVVRGNIDDGSSDMRMKPLVSQEMINETRRRLGSFQVCGLCTCCGGVRRQCLPSPCCYTINCNLPNRPFGLCSFTPKACNCFGCSF